MFDDGREGGRERFTKVEATDADLLFNFLESLSISTAR